MSLREKPLKETAMQYALLIYTNEAAELTASDQRGREMHAQHMAYAEAMQKAGIMTGGERLRPTSAATTVRVAKGKTEVLNGPYAETKEQLGGFYLIEAPDLDTALSWAARCPSASHGTIEVRPIWAM
jgi:hypothetical protein